MVIEQACSRQPVSAATAVELPPATVSRWVRQDRVDRGELVDTTPDESAQLRVVKARISELDAELATVNVPLSCLPRAWWHDQKPSTSSWRPWSLKATGPGGFAGSCHCPARCFGACPGAPSAWAVRGAWLAGVITEVHVRPRGTYGVWPVTAALADSAARWSVRHWCVR